MDGKCSLETLGLLAGALTVEEIAALQEDALRNRLITYSYHLLDQEMRRHIGPNLSWVGFGAWASELAGRCIRGEDIPLREWLPAAVVARVSGAVARGNQWVYADIAPVFRDFLRFLAGQSERERRALAERIAQHAATVHDVAREVLRLDPRPHAEGGQALLCAAFEQYLIAAHEREPDAQAERVFVANGAVGLHEQQHLDPMIREMLAFPALNRVAELTLTPLVGLAALTRPARQRLRRRWSPLGRLAERTRGARRMLEQVSERSLSHALSTRFVLALPLGNEVHQIGRDLAAPSSGAMFPEHLSVFDTRDQRFRALLDEVLAWDRTPDTLAGSAAEDWTDLGDRMNFILDLFRSRQQNPALFANPLARMAG